METKLPARIVKRAIWAAARRLSRCSSRRTGLPGWVIQGTPRPMYDADLAWELLSRTAEYPDSRNDMLALLHEYRYALHDVLAAGTRNSRTCGRSPAASEHRRASARADLARVCTHRHTFARCTWRDALPNRPSRAGSRPGPPPSEPHQPTMALTCGNATRRSICSQVACDPARTAARRASREVH
jgi:hypothetical protein